MNTQISQAVQETEASAALYDKAWQAYCRSSVKGDRPVAVGTTVTVQTVSGPVEIKSVYGGNSRARHVRTTFKLNGKRASKAVIEAL